MLTYCQLYKRQGQHCVSIMYFRMFVNMSVFILDYVRHWSHSIPYEYVDVIELRLTEVISSSLCEVFNLFTHIYIL